MLEIESPAAMAGYSARLAVGTTFTGLLFVFLAAQGEPVTTSAVVVALVALAGGRVAAVARRWDDPAVRARVLGTVAGARA